MQGGDALRRCAGSFFQLSPRIQHLTWCLDSPRRRSNSPRRQDSSHAQTSYKILKRDSRKGLSEHIGSSTTDPNQSNDDLHHIHVCKRSDAGPLVTVYMTAVEPSLIQEQSSGLYEKLAESERSGDGVTKVVAEAQSRSKVWK
jgi:hypothetical protein